METVTLDREMVEALRTERGGFTTATLKALGLNRRTMTQGWPDRLVGKTMTIEEYEQAMEGRLQLTRRGLKTRAKRDRKLVMQAAQQAAHHVHAELDTEFDRALERESFGH